MKRPLWFGRKSVGLGFAPLCWQGWTVLLAFGAAILAAGAFEKFGQDLVFWIRVILGCTLCAIIALTYDPSSSGEI